MKTFLIWVILFLILFPVTIDTTQSITQTQSFITVTNSFANKELFFDVKITEEINCLAINIYHEARGETHIGRLAVAFVTINRAKSGQFPTSICQVVKQKIGNVCQFTWYCTKKKLPNIDWVLYNEIKHLATYTYAFYDQLEDPSNGALFYHANYVRPRWKNMIKTAVIGKHVFYSQKV